MDDEVHFVDRRRDPDAESEAGASGLKIEEAAAAVGVDLPLIRSHDERVSLDDVLAAGAIANRLQTGFDRIVDLVPAPREGRVQGKFGIVRARDPQGDGDRVDAPRALCHQIEAVEFPARRRLIGRVDLVDATGHHGLGAQLQVVLGDRGRQGDSCAPGFRAPGDGRSPGDGDEIGVVRGVHVHGPVRIDGTFGGRTLDTQGAAEVNACQ